MVAVPGLVFDGSATAVGAGERAGERAGDVVGGPVSSVRGFGRLVSRVAPAGGSGVLRRAVVAQVEVGADPKAVVVKGAPVDRSNPHIARVSIVGRPPPTFSSSMGDHSTAFTVHVNAVQSVLEGCPLARAPARMNDLIVRLGTLPGTQVIGNLRSRQAVLYGAAYARLRATATAMLSPGVGANPISDLQECIAAYLEFREIVPLSTVNTGSVSKATSGKGKGEAADALRGQAEGVPQPIELLMAQVLGLLDIRAVALACIEMDQRRLNDLAPGLTSTMSGDERAFHYVLQHLRSIQTSFPGALSAIVRRGPSVPPDADPHKAREAARAADEQAVQEIIPDLFLRTVMPQARQCLVDELPLQRDALAATQRDLLKLRPPTGSGAPGKKRIRELEVGTNTVQAGETRAGLLADEKTQRTRLNQIERALKMPETAAIDLTVPTASPTDDTDRSRRSSTRKSKATEHFDFTKVNADQQAKQHEVKISKEMAKQSGPPPRQKSAAEIEEENERQGALAIQVVTDAAGIVTYLHSAGRPPSPFASTMGAHTTAWTVHVDRVRQLVVGRSIDQARTAVRDVLSQERTKTIDRLSPAFRFPKTHKDPPRTAASAGFDDLASLQNEIVRHLEEVNLIPGATLPAADIDGKYEAGHRRVLLEHLGLQQFAGHPNPHTRQEVLGAVEGLLDVGAAEQAGAKSALDEVRIDPSQRPVDRLVLVHLRAIEATYPGALAAAGLVKPKDVDSAAVATVVADVTGDLRPTKKRKVMTDAGGTAVATTAVTGPLPAWEPAVFGPLDKTKFDPATRWSTRSFLGPSAHNLAGPADAGMIAPWLDADGNVLSDRMAQFVAAYRADVQQPGVFLGQAEGPAVAGRYGVAVDVYRDTAPGGYVKIQNIGDGDCLIHALSDVRAGIALRSTGTPLANIPAAMGPPAGRAVAAGEVNTVRGTVSVAVKKSTIERAVIDIVHNEIEGIGTQGLGPNVQALMFDHGLQLQILHARYAPPRAGREGPGRPGTGEETACGATPDRGSTQACGQQGRVGSFRLINLARSDGPRRDHGDDDRRAARRGHRPGRQHRPAHRGNRRGTRPAAGTVPPRRCPRP